VIATLADLRFIETGATRLSDVPEAKAAAKTPQRDAHNEQTVLSPPLKSDDELAPGIVVAKGAAASSGLDVELGQAGTHAAKPVEAPLPKADFDLGAPGAGASTAPKAPKAPVENIDLGAPGVAAKPAAAAASTRSPAAADLSMDLAAEMPVKAADVKEAVRASKVMTAVEVPKELQDELDKPAKAAEKPAARAADKAAEKAPAAVVAKPADKAAEKPAAAPAKSDNKQDKKFDKNKRQDKNKKSEAEKKADSKPAEKPVEKVVEAKAADKKADKASEKAAEKKAVTLPKQAPEKTPVAPPAPQQKVSPVLVVLLILALVGGGAFLVWKFVLAKPEAAEQTKAPPPKPAPPAPPAAATSKVVMETPAAVEIKAPAGTIETIEAADKDVKTGDTIATLAGAKALTTELDKLKADLDKANPAIETATKDLSDAQQKENNQAGVTAAQAKLDKLKKPLDDKKAALAKKQADLDKLVIKSTADGKLAVPATVKVGAKTTADQVIATVVRATVPVATFKIPPGTKIGADGNVSLMAGDKTVVCTVSDAQAETIKVTCPADSGLANDTAVKFTLPK
jgi:hypothetical protein